MTEQMTAGAMLEVSALGVSVTCNINGDRQVVLQCHVAADVGDEIKHKLLDGMMALINRQKAIYDLVDLKAELEKHETTRQRFVRDLGDVEPNHQRAVQDLKSAIAKLDAQVEETRKKGYDEHASSGRGGAYTPKGGTLSEINRLGTMRKSLEDQIAKAEGERTAAISNFQVNVGRFDEEIEKLKMKIAAAEATIGG